jgi:antitoxin component YwqK of YwqJK toxin-antitoxin module
MSISNPQVYITRKGIVEIENDIHNNMRNGIHRKHVNGEIVREGYYLDDKRHGLWTWYKNNTVVKIVKYEYGQRHGLTVILNKKHKIEYEYDSGNKVGYTVYDGATTKHFEIVENSLMEF